MRINVISKVVTTVFYSLLFFADGLHAGEAVSFNDLKIAFTGNTVEGKIIKQDIEYKMYLHPSGKLIRLDSNKVSDTGSWNINSKVELCLMFAAQQCFTVIRRGENQFDLNDQKGGLALTVDKVMLGNPEKLKP